MYGNMTTLPTISYTESTNLKNTQWATSQDIKPAIHCGTLIILHQDWLEYPGKFVSGVNCLTVKDAEDLFNLVLQIDNGFEESDEVDDAFFEWLLDIIDNAKKDYVSIHPRNAQMHLLS